MSKELAVITGGLAPKGGLKAQVARGIREQAGEWLETQGYELTPKGRFVMPIANVDGTTAYIVLDLAVSNSPTLFDEPKPKAAKDSSATADVVEIPELLQGFEQGVGPTL